jgi:hypothetical protein
LVALPHGAPIIAVVDEAKMVRLAAEARHLTDSVKMAAYRAKTALVRCITRQDVKADDNGRV